MAAVIFVGKNPGAIIFAIAFVRYRQPEYVVLGGGNPKKMPSSSLERDFYRRRLTRQKGHGGDVSAQRPEIRDHRAREIAAKTAFLLASYQLRVSEDWVVGAPGLEPGTR
jgi:hypothetical protein